MQTGSDEWVPLESGVNKVTQSWESETLASVGSLSLLVKALGPPEFTHSPCLSVSPIPGPLFPVSDRASFWSKEPLLLAT